ncbi:MAG: prolyl oligopeptidase family serine peptidase, partial [Planctomycetaceae bacterium]|nr:prolyl oligopeptidase family serine peptidase [Planctomycetaceae bacterium]
MDYAIAHIPHVDSERLYTVGHSSAGTQALYWSVFEPRLKGVAAFAPVTEIDETELLPLMKFMPITFMSSARQFMPSTHYGRFHCPTFVVHGDADAVVPIDTTKRFVETLSQHGKQSTHLGFFNIGHFDVIDRGIPNVMVWLRDLAGLSDRPIPEPDQSVGTELKSDVLAAWRLEGHLIPAPTNNTCINRYRFNSPVSDTAYDKEQGTLYVARESGDLLAFQVESLNSGVTRCSKRWMESRKIDRVCLRTDSNRTLLAYWEDRGIVIQDLKTNSTLTRTPIEMAVDSGELDRHREICFTVGTDNGGLLVNHQGKNYEVDLGNFRLQNREIKSAFKMPFWRYESFNFPLTPSDSFEQRGYVNPFKIPNDLQERREIFQRVAVTA